MGFGRAIRRAWKGFFREPAPVRRIGRDRVRVTISGKTVTLGAEVMKDSGGYLLDVGIERDRRWDNPLGEPITNVERKMIAALIVNELPRSDGIRATVRDYA